MKNIFKTNLPNFFLPAYLGLLNTKYVLQENDADWRPTGGKTLSPTQSNQFLIQQGLKKIGSFGNFSNELLDNLLQNSSDPKGNKQLISELLNQPALNLYQIDDHFFLPHFYVPTKIIKSNSSVDKLPKIITRSGFTIGDAIYFIYQNSYKYKTIKEFNNLLKLEEKPVLEFKKINDTKYRVNIHGAKKDFPLVFTENYHGSWQLYPVKSQLPTIVSPLTKSDYHLFKGNEGNQATYEEIMNFSQKKWVSTLGNGSEKTTSHHTYRGGTLTLDSVEKYKIDFISKNLYGTIQNDNLTSGTLLETWLSTPLPEINHFIINGFANGWLIKPAIICRNSNFCRKNADYSYDFSLVVEFSSQKYFVMSFALSMLILAFSLIIVVIIRFKNSHKQALN